MSDYFRTVEILLPHKPMSKPRPRRSANGGVFMPQSYRDWQQTIELEALSQFQGDPLEGALQMSLIVAGPNRGRYDLEGVFGAVADAISGSVRQQKPPVVLVDDSQIIAMEARFEAAPTWLLSVTVRQVHALDWEKAAKAARKAKKAVKA